MLTFPTLSQNPELPINTELIYDTSITHYEGKVEQRRASRTRERHRFPLSYRAVSTRDKELLESFFILTRGPHRRFTWIDPEGVSRTVKFENEELDMEYVSITPQGRIWNFSVKLVEVF